MNKFIKTVATAGSVALILTGTAVADPPANFDVYTLDGTNMVQFGDYGAAAGTQTCPDGYTCGTPVTGKGFLQRQLIDGGGNQFFQTIVTPEDAVGAPAALAFSDETFVRVGTTGLSGKQAASETAAGTTFATSTIVNSGWAALNGAGTYNELEVAQSITVNDGSQDTAFNSFTLNQAADAAGTVNGKYMDVTQAVMITADATTTDNLGDDMQKFVMRQASGNLNNNAHVLGAPVLLPNAAVTDVAWAATDDVKVVWVGQQMPVSGVESFRFQFYDNLTTAAADSISDFQVGASTTPWTWVQPFGAVAPVMTIP